MLKDKLCTNEKRNVVIMDCVTLIEKIIASQKGLSGIATKSVYKLIKSTKPNSVYHSVDHMLEEFVDHLDPFYASATKNHADIVEYFTNHREAIAESLIEIADNHAQSIKNRILHQGYTRMRSNAQKHVEEAVPDIAALIKRHV
ncbi:MAG: hypothetical protein JW841_13910 [Deltaproteobacteria bacterium]|nr:hypothetical protein [Deltaproteobacteria bacterium]